MATQNLKPVEQLKDVRALGVLPNPTLGTGPVRDRKLLNWQLGGMVNGTGSNTSSNELDKGVTNMVSNK